MRKAQHQTFLTAVTAFLALSASSLAQTAPASSSSNASNPGSLGSVARGRQGGKAAPTKHVFSNDDMEATDEPLPRLNLKIGPRDNSADIVAAIISYRQTHTIKQAEDTVHAWFDLYDRTLDDAIVGLNDHQSARQTNAQTMHEPCPGEFAADCERERQAAVHKLINSDPVLNKDNRIIGRIQDGLKNVRDGLRMKNIRYSWFLIRASDGYGSY
jgi:hypothetical protein